MVSGPVRCSFALRPAGSLTRRPGLLHQGLRAFHCFKARLGCYRLERKLPGGFALPLEFCAFPRRTQTGSNTATLLYSEENARGNLGRPRSVTSATERELTADVTLEPVTSAVLRIPKAG